MSIATHLVTRIRSRPIALSTTTRSYFTNTDTMKRDDPYAQLGLQWGDGATTAEIRAAYRRKAAELHPDVNTLDSPAVALRKFQDLQRAYQTLIKVHSNLNGVNSEKDDEWRFSVWRNGDRIAVERDDVAGEARQRPVMPAKAAPTFAGAQLGHPDGRGRVVRRGELLGQGRTSTSSVGRGQSKWVQPKKFEPWNGAAGKKASNFKQQ